MIMNFQSVSQIKEAGFFGFVRIEDLYNSGYSSVPERGGVYLILRVSDAKPVFVSKGTGGYFKGKEPNVSIDELKSNWVDGTCVMYIGKSSNLRKRVSAYVRFGHGKNVGHFGGRLIWQLYDCHDLIVCWKPTDNDSRMEEASLIQEFVDYYGMRPFANLQD
jgi:hypothetical protein